ncbi:MAG: hypothetical protein IT320_11805 [Anaerolineae bacterium]|nr:hypothetical protein [Anaerolineae bacterium]
MGAQAHSSRGAHYEIRVEGHVDPAWSVWFSNWAISPLDNGETLITGYAVDQPALHGVLTRLRDLNLKLIGVKTLE